MRKFILSCGYLGFIPGAPGTYGSAAAVGLYLIAIYMGASVWTWPILALASGVLLIVVGVPAAPGGGKSDPKWCVLDEVCGVFVAVSGHPDGSPILTAAAALVFFRLFDILKPPPIRQLEYLPGAWGVLLDDVGAGVMANICILGAQYALNML